MPRKPPRSYQEAQAAAAKFDEVREALAKRCAKLKKAGFTLSTIAATLNDEGLRTKTGKAWQYANVWMLMKHPKPPKVKPSKAAAKRAKRASRKRGENKRSDPNLAWVARSYPELEAWRRLCVEWLKGKEAGLSAAIQGACAVIEFIAKHKLPALPVEVLLQRTVVPNFYESTWGSERTHGSINVNNSAHALIEWALGHPDYCEEDDDGCLRRSPAFRNFIPHLSRSGIPRPPESVHSTLPYGYIEELRKMIAEGPTFRDWKWAQQAMGRETPGDSGEELKLAPLWYEVDRRLIDESDPDCVSRTRVRTVRGVPGNRGGGRRKETICELWSPVRWVALLLKLQLPLRTFQVRMLDSGEADTWCWQDGSWHLNSGKLAKGDERHPYANGIFVRPNSLVDGDAKVLLHINTNKTADREKAGPAKGYDVAWVVGGPTHQDPYYWLQRLQRWQKKYNPISKLTPWSDLDGRHIPAKSDVQLSRYPDTAFLFRTPENSERPDLPLAMLALERPWFLCLQELQGRLARRGETLPNGDPIRLIPSEEHRVTSKNTTFFPLHSLRVSLLTALALEGEVPLAILQKVAGHSRLVMTLFYMKPGAAQSQRAIQAGLQRLNEAAGATILDWLANAEYDQLVRDAIANSLESLKAAVPEQKHLRCPTGWMAMVDGLCLVGGNNVEPDAPGCHNGGPNIGSETAPRHAPVEGGARNCPMCRWFVTRPYFLPQLATRWNNTWYHLGEAREQVLIREGQLRDIEDRRAAALEAGEIFLEDKQYKVAQRVLEQTVQKFNLLLRTLGATTRLMERCRVALYSGNGNELMGVGGLIEFNFAIEEVDSELLQVSGVCEGSLLYPDLDPGKAVLRQGQILDAALMLDNIRPLMLTLSEEEQKLVGSAIMRELASRMNPTDPVRGRYEVISLVDARKSLRERLGPAFEDALRVATKSTPHRIASLKSSLDLQVA